MVKINQHISYVQEGIWLDFRSEVKKTNPELFHLIEQINPNKKFKLFKVTYSYGDKITDQGMLCLPDKNGIVRRLDDERIDNHFRNQLAYCATPMMLQLKNGSEAFIEAGERIIPLNIFKPGDLYSLFEVMGPLTNCPITPSWSVTAGARSVFLGAKITDKVSHKRLRSEYGVPEEPPSKLSEQWEHIKVVARRNQNSKWSCQVLIFSGDWFVPNDNDIDWMRFHYYIAKKSWAQARNSRIMNDEFSILQEDFNLIIGAKRLKPSPYIIDTVIHNAYLANGSVPGFKPSDGSELLLPSATVEHAYEKVYQLKENYAPVIMEPAFKIPKDHNQSLFYSLAYPTLLIGSSASRTKPNTIVSELREVKRFMLIFQEAALKDNKYAIFDVIKNAQFEFFHTEPDKFSEVSDSEEILKDNVVMECMKRFKNKVFPYQGPFFHGFMRFSKKKITLL